MSSHLNGSKFKLFLKNMLYLTKNDVKEQLIEQRLNGTFNSILSYSMADPEYNSKYAAQIAHLKQLGRTTLYPAQEITFRKVESGKDKKLNMPYVIHNGKKLYYPKSYSVKDAELSYHYIVDCDRILGTDTPGSPHQYQDNVFRLNKGDLLVDVGCAEALFALDNIDMVSKAILIECSSEWIKALKATFAPYKDKVQIVNKLVTDHDSRSTVKLATLLENETSPAFIKMDIEGFEVATVRSATEFLSQRADITLACCTYHKSADADSLERLFTEIGYRYTFSDGYMLFARYDQPAYPYFRHGLIRARKG